jgi:hypothetical protein
MTKQEIEYTRGIVSFYELPEAWQAEALSNDKDQAEDIMYILPEEDKNPKEHYLLDLSECMKTDNNSEYDGIIGISNCLAIGVNISPCGTACKLTYLS